MRQRAWSWRLGPSVTSHAGSWSERAVLQHTGEGLCLAFSPNGERMAAGSWDGAVRVWKLE